MGCCIICAHCFQSDLITMHALYDTQRGSFMSYSDCAGSNGSHDKFLYGLQGVKVTIKIALSTISFLIVTRAELCGFVALKKRLLICMRRDVLLDVYCCLLPANIDINNRQQFIFDIYNWKNFYRNSSCKSLILKSYIDILFTLIKS